MSLLEWKVLNHFYYKGKYIPLGDEVPSNCIRYHSPRLNKIMPIVRPLDYLYNQIFTSGFIRRIIRKWIRESIDNQTTYLDVGCGNLALRRQLPRNTIYNAFDMSFSESALDLSLRLDSVNIAIASATKILLDSNQASIITATEVLEHIPEVDRAICEIHRVAKPNALFLVSIPNNYCNKYTKLGQHHDHSNSWTYDEFISYIESWGFEFIKGCQKGWWIPFPSYLTRDITYHLPIASEKEFYNTNFFYKFKVSK